MKIFLLLFGLAFTLNLKSQKLSETFEWIKIAVESNSLTFLSLSADSTKLIVIDEAYGDNIFGVRQTIALNKIRSANIEEDSNLVRLELKCTSERCVHIEFKEKNTNDYNPKYAQNVITLSILFRKNIEPEMKKRIINAFNNLIKLSGGKVIDNKF